MAVQSRLDIDTRGPFLSGSFKSEGATLAQDAGETIPTVRMTIMGQISASLKLIPLVAAAVDGSQFPYGIFNGPDVPAADVVAGDVELFDVVKGGDGKVDKSAVVFHNGVDTLNTLVSGKTIESYLNDKGFFFQDVVDGEEYENA